NPAHCTGGRIDRSNISGSSDWHIPAAIAHRSDGVSENSSPSIRDKQDFAKRAGCAVASPRSSAVKVPSLPRSAARDSPDQRRAKYAKTLCQSAAIPLQKEERESGAARFQVADSGRVAAKAGCVKCGEYPNAVRCFRPRLG